MAISQNVSTTRQPTIADRLQYKSATPDNSSHALKIYDTFEPSRQGDTWVPGHGAHVAEAARSSGFQGSIVAQENQTADNVIKALVMTRNQMAVPGQTSEQVLGLLDQHVQFGSQALMLKAAQSLTEDTKAGVTGGVTNFSLAAAPSGDADQLYNDKTLVDRFDEAGFWKYIGQGDTGQRCKVNNLARAWNIDPGHLTSPDPAVYGPARAKFQQKLIDRVHQAQQSKAVQDVHKFYGQAVDAYESKGNSVVVAAGNEGFLLDQMKIDNGGQALTAPKNFEKNVLATPSTTVVGASGVRGFDAGGKPFYSPAPYSNRDGVTIYASGDLPSGQGTSYAAPRVAALMTELHQTYPGLSSAQIENLARHQLSDQPLAPGISEVR